MIRKGERQEELRLKELPRQRNRGGREGGSQLAD